MCTKGGREEVLQNFHRRGQGDVAKPALNRHIPSAPVVPEAYQADCRTSAPAYPSCNLRSEDTGILGPKRPKVRMESAAKPMPANDDVRPSFGFSKTLVTTGLMGHNPRQTKRLRI